MKRLRGTKHRKPLVEQISFALYHQAEDCSSNLRSVGKRNRWSLPQCTRPCSLEDRPTGQSDDHRQAASQEETSEDVAWQSCRRLERGKGWETHVSNQSKHDASAVCAVWPLHSCCSATPRTEMLHAFAFATFSHREFWQWNLSLHALRYRSRRARMASTSRHSRTCHCRAVAGWYLRRSKASSHNPAATHPP